MESIDALKPINSSQFKSNLKKVTLGLIMGALP